ncbi:DUF4340 domain-containing protein [candidate division KSB1 bacterium]
MKFKNTLILGIFVIVLAAYVYFVEIVGESKKTEAEEKAKKIFLFEKENVTNLTLKRGSDTPLVFKKEGVGWLIKKPLEYKADNDKVEDIISSLYDASKERTVSENESDFDRFGLGEDRITVAFTSGMTGIDSLHIGKKNPTASFSFVRKNNENNVYLTNVSVFNSVAKSLYNFRDKTILELSRDDVKRITRIKGKEKIVLKRDFGKNFEIIEPEVLEADLSKLAPVFNNIINGEVKEFIDESPLDLEKYGLDDPFIELEFITGENDAKKTLFIGDKTGKQYFVKDDSKEAVFKIDSSIVSTINFSLFEIRNKEIFKFKTDTVNLIKLIYADSSLVFEKDTLDNWNITSPIEAKAISWKLRGIVNKIKQLKAQNFLENVKPDLQKWGLSKPQVSVKLQHNEKLIAEISFGILKDDNIYIIENINKKCFLVKKQILEDLLTSTGELKEE